MCVIQFFSDIRMSMLSHMLMAVTAPETNTVFIANSLWEFD